MCLMLLLLWGVAYFQLCLSAGLMGPADIQINYIQKCTDEQGLVDLQLKQSSKGRNGIVVSFNVTMPFDFSDSLSVVVGISINTNGGWKPNYYNAEFDKLCTTIKNHEPELFQKMAQFINASNSCPLPKGYYSVTDYNLSKNKKNTITDVYLYTKFKINVKTMLKKKVVTCFDLFAESVPKKPTNNRRGG